MNRRWRSGACLAVALGLLLECGCRGRAARAPHDPAVGTVPEAGLATEPERAAILLVAETGAAKLVCLPGSAPRRDLFPGTKLRQVLDATWKDGAALVAALAARTGGRRRDRDGGLMLLSTASPPRVVARDARLARFSPAGDALAFETDAREPLGGGAVAEVAQSHVLELATGQLAELGEVADPLWEADSQHLRATHLRRTVEDQGAATAVRWTSRRARWLRASQKLETWGRGSAQIPAPVGTGVAWSEEQRSALGPSQCAVRINRGGPQHAVVGPFCSGIADDRGVRWSPDGRWVAFARPGPVPGERQPGTFFIDVVGLEGGRYPSLSRLYARVGPGQEAIAVGGRKVWMDWSPSGRFLAVQDGEGDVRLLDFERYRIDLVAKGGSPTWSPGGSYLLLLAAPQPAERAPADRQAEPALDAVILRPGTGVSPVELGPVRDVRWLPAAACEPAT